MNAASFWAGREDQARNGDQDYPDVSGGGVPYPPQPVTARPGAAPGQAATAGRDLQAEVAMLRDELENALRIMLMSRDTADAALAIRQRTGLLPLKPVTP